MENQIKIVSGKMGWHLKIGDKFINHGFNGDVKAILCNGGIPYGATEWVSVEAIRNFWSKYRISAVASINFPYESVYGSLIPIYPLNAKNQIK